jgi:hypothetical protein
VSFLERRMPRDTRRARRVLCAGTLLLMLVSHTAQARALTEGPRLAAIYDAILDAQFETAEAQLQKACPPAPEGACAALRLAALWWQIQINPESRLLDLAFSDLAESTIASNEAWTTRDPARAEAWFYLAAAYGPRVQWRVLRGQRLAAARDGKKIKDALERALALDSTLHDAYFGIGLYHYYAAVAPAPARLLRWLLLLPGGDRVAGLREMLQARDRGLLLTDEADFQLHLIYLWYEKRTSGALALLDRLDARHPHNPLFLQRKAEAYAVYAHDYVESVAAWRALLSRADAGAVHLPDLTQIRARLGLASAFTAMNRPSDAIDQLQRVVDMQPEAPAWARERAERELRAARARNVP